MGEFLKSSSVVASLPTLLYLGFAQRKNRIDLLQSLTSDTSGKLQSFLSIPYEFLPLAVSLVYGIAYTFVGTPTGDSNTPGKESRSERRTRIKKSLIVGALTGLSLSLVGRFGLNLPTKMFGMPTEKAYTVHLVAPVLYMLIFLYVSYLMQLQ